MFLGFSGAELVLPGGIEPTTSPLPRECSTTELRQRLAFLRADTCHRWTGFATPSLDGFGQEAENIWMTQQKTAQEQRKERLAKALKANMAKRKAQAKTRVQAQPPAEKPQKD